MPEFHAEAPQATVSEGLAQGPYMAARAGVKPMTLRTKGVDSTNAPHTPHDLCPLLIFVHFSAMRLNTIRLKQYCNYY